MAKHLFSIKVQQYAKTVSQKDSNYLQIMAWLWSKILRVCSMINLQRPVNISKKHLYLPLAVQGPLDMLYYVGGVSST